MIYLLLIYEFFKVGLFAVGGGYATLPFLYEISKTYNWYSAKDLVDMLAVSSITPGPVGINVATYAGFKTAGIPGAVIATGAEILPALIIVILIYKLLNNFKENFYIQSILYAIKPAGCALVSAIAIKLFKTNILRDIHAFDLNNLHLFIDVNALILFIILLIMSIKIKKDPLFYLGVSAICGILMHST